MLAGGVDGIGVATVDVVFSLKIAPGDVVELALRDDFCDVDEGRCLIVDVVVDAVVVVVVDVVDVLDTGRV